MLIILVTCLYLSMVMITSSSSSSSSLLNNLRRHKSIVFQSQMSSPFESTANEGSIVHLNCSFLSNFDTIDIFWLHNGTLIESFLSKTNLDEEDDSVEKKNDENAFLGVTIVSTLTQYDVHLDMAGYYQCIAVHNEVHAARTLRLDIIPNKAKLFDTHSTNRLITVHTSQALFEPRSRVILMCRVGGERTDLKKTCFSQWFDTEENPLKTIDVITDLTIQNATFDNDMGLYTCRVCCDEVCQSLTTFVYPAALDK